MIKLLIIIVLIIIILSCINKNYEKFHELTNQAINVQNNEAIPSCLSCSYCYFNPKPEEKNYIISRCLKQHTQTNGSFKPSNQGCASHRALSIHSGCSDAINTYSQAFNNLLEIANNSEYNHLKYNYDVDNTNNQSSDYQTWLNSFN